ncbi:MAG: hypothetical protein IKS07_01975 [Lachnospiraceae bacterium]|nr:hypothetical protein [Lachnospiraceae bacterium]
MEQAETAKIEESLRESVLRAGHTPAQMAEAKRIANLDEADSADFERELDRLHDLERNPVELPKTANPVKRAVQKMISRLTLFSVHPAFQHQNRYNCAATALMEKQAAEIGRLQEEVTALRTELEALKKP